MGKKSIIVTEIRLSRFANSIILRWKDTRLS